MDSQNNRILAVIPARAGSKRIPGKNRKLLAGRELIRYIIEASLNSSLIDCIVVSSDDEIVLSIAEEYDRIIPIRRPPELAGDKSPAIDYVLHILGVLKEEFDLIVILQPSSPFTTENDIDSTINLINKYAEADSAVSVVKLDHAIHPLKLKTRVGDQLIPYIEDENGRMAEHELPDLYIRNCSVYVSRHNTVLKGSILGKMSVSYIMPRERSLDINDPIDFEFAEFLMKRQYGKN